MHVLLRCGWELDQADKKKGETEWVLGGRTRMDIELTDDWLDASITNDALTVSAEDGSKALR